VTHPYQPIKSLKDAFQKKGFSLVEFLAPCPTAYGRRNKLGDIKKLWKWYDDNTILIEDYERIMMYGSDEEKDEIKNMFPVGVFQDHDKPGFFGEYRKLVNRLLEKDGYIPSKVKPKVVVRK
jgi:2-oxoglutarate ferredoxin oxidoreductase subunit beta